MNVYQRVAQVMSRCTYVRKDQNKVAGQYTAVKHDDVVAKLRPHLLDAGIVIAHSIVDCDITEGTVPSKNGDKRNVVAKVCVMQEVINVEKPEDRIVSHWNGMGEDSGDKAVGKAISYACKYGLLKTFLLETGDDADNDPSIEVVRAKDSGAVASEADSTLVWAAYEVASKKDKKAAFAALAKALGYQPGGKGDQILLSKNKNAVQDACNAMAAIGGAE